MTKPLTTKAVEAAKPGAARREVPDAGLAGLYLVVQPSGAKSWALRYRFAGKPAKLTLGRWPAVGLADARAAAADALEKIERGSNPSVEKKATKAQAVEAQLSRRDLVATLIDNFDKRHLSALRSGRTVRRELDRHVVSIWGERNIHDISRRDVVDLLDRLADSGRKVTANRVRAYLNTFFRWCVEREVIAANPAAGVRPVAKEVSRDRVLTDDEVRAFWQACDGVGYPWGHMGRLLLLTGQRLAEIAEMTRDEVKDGTLHLSSDRTKNKRPHIVPLPDAALAVLADCPHIGPHYFTTNGSTPVSGFHKARDRIAAQMPDGPRWTFHDLRRTAATGMARLGIPVHVVEAVLNHASGAVSGVAGIYNRHTYNTEKRQALAAWAAEIDRIVTKAQTPDNVVRLVR